MDRGGGGALQLYEESVYSSGTSYRSATFLPSFSSRIEPCLTQPQATKAEGRAPLVCVLCIAREADDGAAAAQAAVRTGNEGAAFSPLHTAQLASACMLRRRSAS